MTTERTPSTAAGRALLAYQDGDRGEALDAILAIEAEARAPLVAALQPAYDLIMLLAFAKPEAAEGVPKTFAVLDELRAALREDQP